MTSPLDKLTNWYNFTYFRGRTAYNGDRIKKGVKTYWLEGYPGENLGDEIIYKSITDYLSPGKDIFLSRFLSPGDIFNSYVKKRTPLAIVFGGGTLQPGVSLPRIKRLKEKLPLYTFGVGTVGYAKNATALDPGIKESWLELFELTQPTLIGVRGPRSKKIMDSLGQSSIITGDTAISLFDHVGRRKQRHILLNFGNHNKHIAPATLELYRNIVTLAATYQVPVKLIPFHESDKYWIREVIKSPRPDWGSRVSVMEEIPSISQFQALMRDTIFGIGERLHFGIALISSGIPSLMLGYLDKHLDFAESINAENYVFEIKPTSMEAIQTAITDLESNQFQLPEAMLADLDQLRDLQRRHLQEASEIFSKSKGS